MATPYFPGLVYKHRGLAADQHLTQEEWNQVGAEVEALETFHKVQILSAIPGVQISGGGVSKLAGGVMVARSELDARMPNGRWYASAYFWTVPVSGGSGPSLTVDLLYTRDDLTDVVLGSQVYSGSGLVNQKRSVAAVEFTQYMETVICVRLKFTLSGSGGPSIDVPGGATIVLTGERRT